MAALVWILATGASVAALFWAYRFYSEMMEADEGTDLMREIAASVRAGADAYLKQQYRMVAVVFVVVAILLAVASFVLKVQSGFVPVAFPDGRFL